MPELDYGKTNVRETGKRPEYPKLDLKLGEKARIFLIEKAPVYEWVHEMKAPKLVDGEPVMVTRTNKKGDPYQVHDFDFITRSICLGDDGTLSQDAYDPANCPMCAYAKKNPDAIKGPERRFATTAMRYKTKVDTFQLAPGPFAVEALVWSYTERMFGVISDFIEEWGDLRTHDLNLTCTSGQYKNYDPQVAQQALWLEDEQRKSITVETYKARALTDLSLAIGSRTPPNFVAQNIARIDEAWKEVAAFTRRSANIGGQSLDEGLGALSGQGEGNWATPGQAPAATGSAPDLDDVLNAPAPAASSAPSSDALDSLTGEGSAPASAPETPQEPAQAPQQAPATSGASSPVKDDLDALLG